ncbi:MAG: substrate-binding domain-containing protein [Candidatus Omnitrophica bacterium]|nr:substrate-binding domain-containing protein [Candidatus Omnitrophota bacterium]
MKIKAAGKVGGAERLLASILGSGAWLVAALVLVLVILSVTGCGRRPRSEVVVYTSQDHVYAEPILLEFTRKTSIRVATVYDSEAVKTVGLANRLLAEKNRPQCDLFWNNEEFRTRQLAAQGVFRETNGWQAFGCRHRCLVVNVDRLRSNTAPNSLIELTNSNWRGKVALAYPLFGTTATHFLALRQRWGEARWRDWCRALQANQPFLVDGNSVVVNLVGHGEAWIGLTDSDDVQAGLREGMPIREVPLTQDGLLIPNTVGVVRGAPHPEAAQQLFVYLQSPDVTAKLIQAHALQDTSAEAPAASRLPVDWVALLRDLEPATAELKQLFLR